MTSIRFTGAQIVAIALAPLLAVGLLLGLIGHGGNERVDAAVVNLDQAVTIEGQMVPMGRQFAAELIAFEDDNVSWTLADAPSAREGLSSGRFSAVVTIPENFSKNATSWSANDAAQAEQARIDVAVSDNSPITDAQIAEQIARIATTTINSQLTEGYLDGIYVGFNTVGEQFGEMLDGVSQLADGSAQLADGTAQSADGAVALSDGMTQLRDGGGELAAGGAQFAEGMGDFRAGVSQLNSGAGQLAGGANQLADGIDEFAGQAPALAAGAAQLAEGARQLDAGLAAYADGVDEYAVGSEGFSQGVSELSDGALQLAAGADELAGGVSQLADGVDEFAEGSVLLAEGVDELAVGADEYFDGVIQFADGTAALVGGLEQLRDGLEDAITGIEGAPEFDLSGLEDLADAVRETATAAVVLSEGLIQMDATLQAYASGELAPPADVQAIGGELAAGYQCPVAEAEVCALLQEAYLQGAEDGVGAGFRSGTGLGSTLLNTAGQSSAQSLLESAEQLAVAAQGLAAEIADFIESLPEDAQAQLELILDGLRQIAGGIGIIVTESQPLKDNAPLIAEGARQLNAGIQQLNTEIGALPAGAEEMAAGVRELSDGADAYAVGMGGFADGTVGLAAGAEELAVGARDLATGAQALSSGATEFTGGVVQLTDGLAELPGGVEQLSTGARQVADGVDGLAGGVGQLDTGAAELQDGTEDFVAGVGQYAQGVRQAADGTVALSDGLGQLSDGAGGLADGLGLFNSELAAGAQDLPSYSEADREVLANVVASPVAPSGELPSPAKVASTALLIVAGLWLGALGAFALWRPVPRNVVLSRASSVALWAATVWRPAAVVVGQGLVLGVVGATVLGLGFGTSAVLVALMMALGVSFALANHALAGWFGNLGRVLSGVLLVLTVGLGLSSALSWLAPLGAVSPLHNGFELVRTHMADGSGEVSLAAMAVLLAVIALVASVTAVAARRRLTPAQFKAGQGG